MTMLQLNDLLPQAEWEPNWTLLGRRYEGLQDNREYVVFEHYCINPDCDCKSLIAEVMTTEAADRGRMKPLAIIDYEWGSKKTRCKPTLHDTSPRTKTAHYILGAYKEFIHDEEYLNRIKSHYAKIRERSKNGNPNENILPTTNPNKGVGRNDPCPCGSRKKFKKCCLSKAV